MVELEELKRREDKEFSMLSNHFPQMLKVMELLERKKRMDLAELEKRLVKSKDDLTSVLAGCSIYFNVRDQNGGIQISLSPKGRHNLIRRGYHK